MRDAPSWVPVAILFGLLLLAYLAMWRGWRRRGRRHDVPPLVEVPTDLPTPLLQAGGGFFGTATSGQWLDRVVARGLGTPSTCRLSLSAEALDVLRPTGSFRIPAAALRGAHHDQGLAGKVVPPHGLLVVTWQHGDLLLDSGFRLTGLDATTGARGVGEEHDVWVRAISKRARENV